MGAHHEPVQPYLIKPKMEQLLQEYSASGDHIVTKLARFHMVAFCFSMTVGVVWEFIECAADIFLSQDAQKDL